MDNTTPARPRRARGRSRLTALLDAADGLLRSGSPASISLRDIARRAGVPAASAYHYFPDGEAVLLALAKHYHLQFEALPDEGLDPVPPTWPDLLRALTARARRFYEQNPAAMQLFLGADVGGKVRAADLDANRRIATRQLAALRRHFDVPDGPVVADAIALAITISDAIWSSSFIRHGRITDDLAEEAARAKQAYLALIIPTP